MMRSSASSGWSLSEPSVRAGFLEQDDGENWGEVQATNRGVIARRVELNYQMGLGHVADSVDGFPGRPGHVISEHAARKFYRRWHRLLESETYPPAERVPFEQSLKVQT